MKKQKLVLILSLILIKGTAFAQGNTLSNQNLDNSPSGENTVQYRSLQEKNSSLSTDWKTSLSGLNSNNENAQSKLIDFRLEMKFGYLLTPELKLDFSPIFKFQSGSKQTLESTDKSDNRILLNEAALRYTPISSLELSAGALSQSNLHTSLLIEDIPFPAARLAGFVYENNQSQIKLLAETAIPTSSSLSPNTNEFESTPALNSISAQYKYKKSIHQYWKNTISSFSYSNLPSAVAAQSALMGNTAQRQSESDGAFQYQYSGYEAKTEFRSPLVNSLDITLAAEYLKNTLAPEKLNTGLMTSVEASYFLKTSTCVNFKSSYFRIEPDASVAYFSSNRYFNTNRVGYSVESSIVFFKEAYKVGIKFTEAEVIYLNSVQSREKSILLKLETAYAEL